MISSTKNGLPSERSTTNARTSVRQGFGPQGGSTTRSASPEDSSVEPDRLGVELDLVTGRPDQKERALNIADRREQVEQLVLGPVQIFHEHDERAPTAASSSNRSTHASRSRWTTSRGCSSGGAGWPSATPRMGHRSTRSGRPPTDLAQGGIGACLPERTTPPNTFNRRGPPSRQPAAKRTHERALPDPRLPQDHDRELAVASLPHTRRRRVGRPTPARARRTSRAGRARLPAQRPRSARRHATPSAFPFASTVVAGPNWRSVRAAATVRSPTRISSGFAACSRRAATFTASPVTNELPTRGSPTTTSPVLTPIRSRSVSPNICSSRAAHGQRRVQRAIGVVLLRDGGAESRQRRRRR